MSRSAFRVCVIRSGQQDARDSLGRALQDHLPYVTLCDTPDPSADILYFLDPSQHCTDTGTTAGPIVAGWMSQDTPNMDGILQTARKIDQPVAGSDAMRDALRDAGLAHAVAIPPTIDPGPFNVRLRIGVPGAPDDARTALLAPLADMAGIDWRLGDSGWPMSASDRTAPDPSEFYRALDYLLITDQTAADLHLHQALAVGIPVIAPQGSGLGLPHVGFAAGNSADLHRALRGLMMPRLARRAEAATHRWISFVEAHDRLFHELIARRSAKPAGFDGPVCLLMHGDEQKALGGPSVRVPRTAQALRMLGIPARADSFLSAADIPEDIVHLYNVWPPRSALRALRALKSAGKRVVFSPIYLDFSERPFWQFELPALKLPGLKPFEIAKMAAAARSHLQSRGRLHEVMPGYHAMVREMLALADHVIFLSAAERAALADIGAIVPAERASLIVNPVDAEAWAGGDPAIFRSAYLEGQSGPQDYVICVARIEERKNQLMLAHALRGLPLRLVLVGHVGNPAYAAQLRAAAGPDLVMTGRLESGSVMLRSALAGAQAFALPSWAEGAPLAALEAAASGARMVLSDRSSEQAYFGDLADYCDPGDPGSIRAAVQAAMARQTDTARAAAVQHLLRGTHSWERHARDTAGAYARAAAASAAPSALPASCAPQMREMPQLAVDITPSSRHPRRGTEATAQILAALKARAGNIHVICWSAHLGRFVTVPGQLATLPEALRYVTALTDADDAPPVSLPSGCTLVCLGDGWWQEASYLAGLEDLKQRAQCGLMAMIHDLGPWRAPIWYHPQDTERFTACFQRLAALVDGFIATSQSCAADLAAALAGVGRAGVDRPAPVTRLRLGDPKPLQDPPSVGPVQTQMAGHRFALVTGDLEARANHALLHRLWARFLWARLNATGGAGDLHLVIATAGDRGEAGQALAEQVARDPRVGGKVHVMTGLADGDLSWLYATCLFTLHPAQDEGWALPVATSLAYGKPCLASQSGALPEIAPGLVDLIDPEDFAAWAAHITNYALGADARQARSAEIAAGYSPVPWPDAAADLVRIAAAPRTICHARALYVGEVAQADASAEPLSIHFGEGWHPADTGGRWAAQGNVQLSLCAARARRPGQDHLVVVLALEAHLPDGRVRQFDVSCADQILFSAPVSHDSFPRHLILSVPVASLQAGDLLHLDLYLPTAPAEGAQRGIGVVSTRLLDPVLSNPLWCLPAPESWSAGRQVLTADLMNDAHRAILAPGLAFSAGWGVGAPDGAFTLLVPVLPGIGAQQLTLTMRPVATPDAPVHAVLRWNGRVLTERYWRDDTPDTLHLPLSSSNLAQCGPAVLHIVCNTLQTPADLGLGPTTALAGLGLTDLILTPQEDAP